MTTRKIITNTYTLNSKWIGVDLYNKKLTPFYFTVCKRTCDNDLLLNVYKNKVCHKVALPLDCNLLNKTTFQFFNLYISTWETYKVWFYKLVFRTTTLHKGKLRSIQIKVPELIYDFTRRLF